MSSPATPRVSIVLPCRDAEATLGACIDSLESQTETRFEALVSDDGSTDGTRATLAAWIERDPRVRLIDAPRRGLVPVLRALCAAARGPFLARMDADDVSQPERLAAQLALLEARPDVAACGTGVHYVPRDRVGGGYRRYEEWINALSDPAELERDLYVECPIAHPTLMIRRPILESVGGYREFDGPEDYDLILRLAEAGRRLANVPEVLHDWRLGPDRLSERSARYSPEAFRRLKIESLRRGPLSPQALEARTPVLWGVGKVGKAFLRTWLSAGGPSFGFLVDLDPRKIGQEIHGSPVVDPATVLARFGDSGPRPYVLAAVGSPGARHEIRAALAGAGAREIEDFRVVA